MASLPQNRLGIHGNSSYIEYEYSFFTLPTFLLFVPLLYIPITLIIDLRILGKLIYSKNEKHINVHLFKAILMSQFMCFIFFIADFFHIRLPTTGIFTSWCASVEPNRFLMALYITTFYIDYATMLFPILTSSMRLILILFPQNHEKINGIILKSSIPIISIYPLFFTFFMFPAVGYCQQARYPFGFGSISFHFDGTLFGLKNNMFLLYNSLFWMLTCASINGILLIKLIILKVSLSHHARSHHSFKIELSLTLTTISMIFSYLSNGMVVISAQFFPSYVYYAIMLRPFGNDLVTCVVPWVFYLTHPVFRKKSRTGNIVLNS